MQHISKVYGLRINPCAAELFAYISHSFEAGIDNAVSNDDKYLYLGKNRRNQ